MKWLRWIAAAPLLLLALILTIGAVRIFTGDLPDNSEGGWVSTAVFAAVALIGALFLLRPELSSLRQLTFAQFRTWVHSNPIGQAALLYVIATILMLAAPAYQVAPAVLAVCVFSVTSTLTAALKRRWWAYALLALLGWCLLFLGLTATSEAIAPRGFGEAAMLFLLPMEVFPVLLVVSGIVRLVRGVPEP